MKNTNRNHEPFRVSTDRKAKILTPFMTGLADDVTELKKSFLFSVLQDIWPSIIREELNYKTSQFR